MSFLYQSLLTLGLPLLAAPLAIHLINLRRRRRVEWAAMEFLLESQKRNKRWILLRQFLLLLLRTAAVALAVMMLAGPVVQSGWASLFGRGLTHHLILLDDSYSMADRGEEESVFDDAKRAATQLVEEARRQGGRQEVTLLRFSEARRLSAGDAPQWDRRPLDASTVAEFERFLGGIDPSETDAGPLEAVDSATRLSSPAADETRITYVLSDFRKPQWSSKSALRQSFERLRAQSAKLLLLQCAEAERPNLALTRLEPESGIRAAGIETEYLVEVANYGDRPASPVVALQQDGVRLPAVEFDAIPPGKSFVQRFRAAMPGAGAHALQATLERDAVDPDNRRWFAAELPASFPVLVIDGSIEGKDAYYLQNALGPGGRNVAGWSPRVEPPSYLRKQPSLDEFAAICLLGVPRLEDPDVEALENYVRRGGGVFVTLGTAIDRRFYNSRLYRDGEGLLPAPLGSPTQLLRESSDESPDVLVTDHPIFRIFSGEKNSYLAVARFDFYYALESAWQAPKSGETTVLARLRNGAPLVVERRLGEGRVIVQLSKLSPEPDDMGSWSNWSVNPVFPVYASELVGHLSASRRRNEAAVVDQPITVAVDVDSYLPTTEVQAPGGEQSSRGATQAATVDGKLVFTAPQASRAGLWEFRLTKLDGKSDRRLVAANPPAEEGDLHIAEREEIAERLRGVDYQYLHASQLSDEGQELAGFRLSDAMLYLLLAALAGELLLAASASYHPAARSGA